MPAQVCIYNPVPSLIGARFLGRFKEVKAYRGLTSDGDVSGLLIDLGVARVQINYMPASEAEGHLNGFMGYAQSCIKDQEQLSYALARISDTKLVMGCVIDPGFDSGKVVQNFIYAFLKSLNGVMMYKSHIVDYDGTVLNKGGGA
jgi:hypothetical protein